MELEPDAGAGQPPDRQRAILPRVALAVAVALVALVAAVVALLAQTGRGPRLGSQEAGGTGLPGALTAPAPWPANGEALRERLDAIGLPALGAEGQALHLHVALAIVIDGRSVAIPAGIGLDPERRFVAPIHTHDTSGTIHVESEEVRTFRLGDVFDVWGLPLDERCLGPYCAGDGATLEVAVDGRRIGGDPRDLELRDGQGIVVEYASP